MNRDIKFIEVLKKYTYRELQIYFTNALLDNGIDTGIIDRLMSHKTKKSFIYELFIILDEATNNEADKYNRQKIITEFGNSIDFEFNFVDDDKMLDHIYKNFNDYNKVHSIDEE